MDVPLQRWLVAGAGIDEALKKSAHYGENDLAEALGPVRKAVEDIVAAKANLDKVIEAVRAKAKGK